MGVEQVELSHEEVWDDSALIDSWNEALAEYKKYHSVHAKGGSVKDLESKISQRAPESESNKRANSSEPVSSAGNEDPDAIISRSDQAQSSQKDATAAASAAPPPQALLGSIRDDNLKRLLMSWYYAGYYTGLFEGQQQAQQEEQKPRP
ncbi:hypothetical protein J3459_015008 [Metarhizium acridum]|uniref:uncharacterized protein n=1 Tax=Metarhizium acridum TaxID=92637 RepID=UPI001C6CDEEA|nr:hypothetical protein J3459_015008 [Metarhizium acridum]KAG8419369.1 hypothetical protein J3458_004239 [Metarhizium acridum]